MMSREAYIELGKGDIEWEDETPERDTVIPEDSDSEQLANLADHYLTVEAEIVEMEDRLKTLKETFRRIREDFIPERMIELGVKSYKLTDGSTIGYSQIFAGKVLDEKGYDWLEEHGYADAVKQELRLEVSRVDKIKLDFIKQYIVDHPQSLRDMSIKEKQAIHHMTLGAAIKALTKRGQQLPPELFETFIGNRATIKKGRDNG
jgi:hypothetical protein